MNRKQQIKPYHMAKKRLSKAIRNHSDLTRKCDHYEEMLDSLRGDESKTVGLMVRGHGEVGYPREDMLAILRKEFSLVVEKQAAHERVLIAAAQQIDSLFTIPMPSNEMLRKEYGIDLDATDYIKPFHPVPADYDFAHMLPENPDPRVLYQVTIAGWEHVSTYMLGDLIMVRTGELPTAQQKALNKFMVGQTRPTIESEATQDFIYLWDYERYLKTAEVDESD